VGGAAFDNGFIMPEGVELFGGLHKVNQVLAEWKKSTSGN